MTATAVVTTMPGTRLVAIQRLSCERRMQLLEQLARQALDLEPEFVVILRDALAHDSLTRPAVEEAWDDVLERVAIADAADQGLVDWRCIADDLPCPDRTSAAAEIARQDATEALAALAGGTGR
jgi:hypothetical protein